jgi:hypothetical protein
VTLTKKQRYRVLKPYPWEQHPDDEEAEIGRPSEDARRAALERSRSQLNAELNARPRRTRVRRPIRIDWNELDALADTSFTWSEVGELVDLCTIYAERFREPVTDYILTCVDEQSPKRVELEARRAFVEAVEGVWRESRRRPGRGSFVSRHKGRDGPLLRLLQKLFVAAGEAPPSPTTVHDDIVWLERQRERKRKSGRKRKR